MVRIHDAQVSYPGHIAFSNLSLTVEPGEMVSIVGKSGCGKTSLLYTMTNLVPLSKGSLTITGGTNTSAIMFQQDRLLPWRRIIDNVMIGMPKDTWDRGVHLLARFGLERYANKFPSQLSGGERQRVALARSLVRDPELLLLDEPLASLDEQTREQLQEDIKHYVQSRGITLILVTHSISEAVFMGSRILLMTNAGMSYETENPYHNVSDLRRRAEFFALERTLRAQLGAAV